MPVSIGDFIGLSIDDVLNIEAAAIGAVKSGGTVVSWSSEGSSVSKAVDGSPSDILRACQFAKKHIMPEVYGRNITRTSVSFLTSDTSEVEVI